MRKDEVNASESLAPLISLSSRLLWHSPVVEVARAAVNLGFQGLEIWTEHLWREHSPIELKEQLGQIPLRYFLHAPFMDLNLCSRNPRVAQLSLEEQLRSLELARELGINLVVVHPGRCSSSKDSPEEYWPLLLDTLGMLETKAGELEITLAVENMEPRPKEFMVRPNSFLRLLETLPGLALCLDLAHAAAVGKGVADEFILRLDKHIRHIHISNIDGDKVHLPLDQGHLPITPSVASFIRTFPGAVTLEGAVEPSLRAAQAGLVRLRKLVKGGGDWDYSDYI